MPSHLSTPTESTEPAGTARDNIADSVASPPSSPSPQGSALEVLLVFLKLGLTSFGGPVAHLGYFRTEFVERRRWLSDQDYSDLVALCQFLRPAPGGSWPLSDWGAWWAGACCSWAV